MVDLSCVNIHTHMNSMSHCDFLFGSFDDSSHAHRWCCLLDWFYQFYELFVLYKDLLGCTYMCLFISLPLIFIVDYVIVWLLNSNLLYGLLLYMKIYDKNGISCVRGKFVVCKLVANNLMVM